ncbi:unnamed protein product [Allacma fusca]|uniref:Uncharacterized protein n=1 Tax=Allacma fusca TaxID=39272 RepID=A0A8J2KUR4_9HEXA|nr:unnamed protein product [Allacma fusca]
MKSGKSGKGLEEGENTPCSWKWFSRLSFLREKTYHGTINFILATVTQCTSTTDTMDDSNDANVDGECNLTVNTERPAGEIVTTPKDSTKSIAKKRKSSPTQWTGVIDQLKSVIEVSNSQMTETTSDSFGAYLAKEMEDMTSEERDDFKYDVATLIRNIKRSRKNVL